MTYFSTFALMVSAISCTRTLNYSTYQGQQGQSIKTVCGPSLNINSNYVPQTDTQPLNYNYIYDYGAADAQDTGYVSPANAGYGGNLRDYFVLGGATYFSSSLNYDVTLPNSQVVNARIYWSNDDWAPRFTIFSHRLTELYNVELVYDFTLIHFDNNSQNNIDGYYTWSFTYSLYDRHADAIDFQQLLGPYDYNERTLPYQGWYLNSYLVCSFYMRNVYLADYLEAAEDDTYDIGYQDGYENGYTDGQTNTGSNQFQKLLGVIIDTPIVYLRKMFGYELFGVNLFMALTTIVSLLVALSIFRLVKGIF